MSEDKEDEQGLHRPVTPEGSDQVDFGDPGMAGHALIEMGVPGSPRLPLKKKLISEVTAENLSCRFRIERRSSSVGPAVSGSQEHTSQKPLKPKDSQLIISCDTTDAGGGEGEEGPVEEDSDLKTLCHAIRCGNKEVVTTVLDANWPQIMEKNLFAMLTFEKYYCVDGSKTATVDESDGVGLVEQVKFVFKPFHLALIARRTNIVALMLNKALAQEGHEERRQQLELLIGTKTSLRSLGNNYVIYDKVDLMLDGMTSLHVAARYSPTSLKHIIDHLNRDWEDYSVIRDHMEDRDCRLKQTALHTAVRSSSTVATSLLLDHGADIEAVDFQGYTPLHIAAKAGSEANTQLLLERGAESNAKGRRGKTPMHKARTHKIVDSLLEHGADPYAKISAKGDIDGPKIFTVFHTLLFRNKNTAERLLNQWVDTNGQELDSSDLLLIFDLEMFYHESFGADKNEDTLDEVAAHAKMIGVGAKEFLQHPVSEIMLHLKWQRIRRVFQMNFAFYTLFTLCLTIVAIMQTYMLVQFDKDDDNIVLNICKNDTWNEACYFGEIYRHSSPGFLSSYYTMLAATSILFLFVMTREIIQACYSWEKFRRSKEDLLEFVMLLMVGAYLVATEFGPRILSTHFGAWSIFFVWLELTLLIGRIPSIGLYVFAFTNIIHSLLLFFLVYSPAFLAFALSFHLLLPHIEVFENPINAVIKTLVMMLGELEYEGNFTQEQTGENGSTGTTQIIFAMFVVFVSIILMNLLLALTVSETDKLQNAGDLIRLEKTVNQITSTEDTLVHKPTLLQCFPRAVENQVIKATSIFEGLRKRRARADINRIFKVCVRPFTPVAKPIGKNKSWAYSNTTRSNDEYLEIYFYDEKKGGRGFTTGYKMPKQIAENALRVVSTRYTTEAQEMQMMEQLVHDNGSLSDISSYNQQAMTTSRRQLDVLEEETEAKTVIQNQLLHLEDMKITLQAMTDRLARLQESL